MRTLLTLNGGVQVCVCVWRIYDQDWWPRIGFLFHLGCLIHLRLSSIIIWFASLASVACSFWIYAILTFSVLVISSSLFLSVSLGCTSFTHFLLFFEDLRRRSSTTQQKSDNLTSHKSCTPNQYYNSMNKCLQSKKKRKILKQSTSNEQDQFSNVHTSNNS